MEHALNLLNLITLIQSKHLSSEFGDMTGHFDFVSCSKGKQIQKLMVWPAWSTFIYL